LFSGHKERINCVKWITSKDQGIVHLWLEIVQEYLEYPSLMNTATKSISFCVKLFKKVEKPSWYLVVLMVKQEYGN
jgi:hypothetical protein